MTIAGGGKPIEHQFAKARQAVCMEINPEVDLMLNEGVGDFNCF
jgi:hypothetical protein